MSEGRHFVRGYEGVAGTCLGNPVWDPAQIIGHAARLYHVFSLRLRDIKLLLAERGVVAF